MSTSRGPPVRNHSAFACVSVNKKSRIKRVTIGENANPSIIEKKCTPNFVETLKNTNITDGELCKLYLELVNTHGFVMDASISNEAVKLRLVKPNPTQLQQLWKAYDIKQKGNRKSSSSSSSSNNKSNKNNNNKNQPRRKSKSNNDARKQVTQNQHNRNIRSPSKPPSANHRPPPQQSLPENRDIPPLQKVTNLSNQPSPKTHGPPKLQPIAHQQRRNSNRNRNHKEEKEVKEEKEERPKRKRLNKPRSNRKPNTDRSRRGNASLRNRVKDNDRDRDRNSGTKFQRDLFNLMMVDKDYNDRGKYDKLSKDIVEGVRNACGSHKEFEQRIADIMSSFNKERCEYCSLIVFDLGADAIVSADADDLLCSTCNHKKSQELMRFIQAQSGGDEDRWSNRNK